jgi:Glycine zipper
MNTAWKYLSVGIAAVAMTAVTSSVMTAYVMRPSIPDTAVGSPGSDVPDRNAADRAHDLTSRRTTEPASPLLDPPRPPAYHSATRSTARLPRAIRVATTMTSPESTAPSAMTPDPAVAPPAQPAETPAASRVGSAPAVPPSPPAIPEHVTSAPLPPPVVATPVPPAPAPTTGTTPPAQVGAGASHTASTPADCANGTDRALKIAKPGALGGLLGAVLGAAGGAIAHGGKGAGQGALIGAGVGVVAGSGWGAYKTKQDCGTVLGAR